MSSHVTRYYTETGFFKVPSGGGPEAVRPEQLVQCALTAIRHFGGIYTYASRARAPLVTSPAEFFGTSAGSSCEGTGKGWAQLSLVLTYLEICVALHNIFVKTRPSGARPTAIPVSSSLTPLLVS